MLERFAGRSFALPAIHVSFDPVDFGTPYGGRTIIFVGIDRVIIQPMPQVLKPEMIKVGRRHAVTTPVAWEGEMDNIERE